MLGTKVLGNLSRSSDHDRHRLQRCLLCLLFIVNGKRIDIEPGPFSQGCFEVSIFFFWIRLLRHDESVHREEDGAVRFDDLAELLKSTFEATSHWSTKAWTRFQYCLNLYHHFSEHFLYFRAIQGHSGRTLVDATVQDNVQWTIDVAEYIYHVGNAHDMHSIFRCGLISGGKKSQEDRQSVFFTAVKPTYIHQNQGVHSDLDKPRIAVYKNTWRIHPNTVSWCNLKLAQRKGLQFCQTQSNAIALLNTVFAKHIEKVEHMKTGEEI